MIGEIKAKEGYQSTAALAKQYGFSDDTVRRWITGGVRVAGQVVRLEALRIGKSWRVPPGGMEKFLRKCNGGKLVQPEPESQNRQHKEAERYLKEMGVG